MPVIGQYAGDVAKHQPWSGSWEPGHQRRAGDTAVITVSDDGPGIPAELLPRIFDPFFTTKDVGEGSGLGLSIVHGIIERHGGKISVDSEPGHGARFTVRLPVRRAT